MLDKLFKKQGNTLIGVLVVIVVIIFVYFSSLFFLDENGESNIEKASNILEEAENKIDNINKETENKNEIIESGIEGEDVNEETIFNETDFDVSAWREAVIDSEGFKIKYYKSWYYTVNRREALQDGYKMIVGFEEDENIWEKLPPLDVELIVLEKDANFEKSDQGYLKEITEKDNLKYILYTEKEEYKNLVDKMLDTFEFLDNKIINENVEEEDRDLLGNWKIYKDEEFGIEFKYPEEVGAVIKEGNRFYVDGKQGQYVEIFYKGKDLSL
ncbi:hypothetical protein K8R62_00095, partial [bacterium]|nr:hypothetical protein [bacterium]